MGVSGGGPFAAACAARLPGRVRSLTLVCPLGAPDWPTREMASGQRLVLPVARHAPAFGGWFLGRLAGLGRRSPALFHRLTTSGLPGTDRRALGRPGGPEASLAGWTEAFRQGSWGVAQDLRMLMKPWGFELSSITVPTWIHHGDADTTVPPRHARLLAEAIPGAQLRLYPGLGHYSILDVAEDMLAALAG
jgi:pimeloyl-ACP methyl ester carboxylesterase